MIGRPKPTKKYAFKVKLKGISDKNEFYDLIA